MSIVTVTQKGQVLIPKAIREKAGIRPRSRVYVSCRDDAVNVRPVPADPVEAGFGLARARSSLSGVLRKERRREHGREDRKTPR